MQNEHQLQDSFHEIDQEHDWGKLLYRSHWYFKLHWCIFILCVLSTVVFIFLMNKVDEVFFYGIIVSGLGVLGSSFATMIAKAIDIYEKGVVYKTMIYKREMTLENVEKYTFVPTALRKFGLYQGSTFDMFLTMEGSSRRIWINLQNNKHELPEPLKIIRQRVHEVCVARMLKQLEEKNATRWTKDILLEKNEIVIATRKKTYRVPYQELIVNWDSCNGEVSSEPLFRLLPQAESFLLFYIKGDTSSKPIFKLSPETDNFFSGYDCLRNYCHFDKSDDN